MRAPTTFLTIFALLSFANLAFADDNCICSGIKVRNVTDKTALGPDGDGKTGWPPQQNKTDGKHLGPSNDDPDNPADALQEKVTTGYAFEVVTTVKGKPDKCREIQLVKGSLDLNFSHTPQVLVGKKKWSAEDNCGKILGGAWDATTRHCSSDKTWIGTTYDPDLSGPPAIDVSDKDKCTKAGGRWFSIGKCGLKFPQTGKKYGPDTPMQTQVGAADGGA